MDYTIYYGNESTYTSDDGPPEQAPKRGVQVIIQGTEDGTDPELLGAMGYYWWDFEHDLWLSGDVFGFYDYMIQPGEKVVLFGRTLTNKEYQSIRDRAIQEGLIQPD